jgi:uncharacterized pyridoxal phosphate-containing UPF0001 family protein
MTNQESLKQIDVLIAEEENLIKDKEMLKYVKLLFVRLTLITENVATVVKESFEKVTENYNGKFEEMTSELKKLRKDMGYSNGN